MPAAVHGPVQAGKLGGRLLQVLVEFVRRDVLRRVVELLIQHGEIELLGRVDVREERPVLPEIIHGAFQGRIGEHLGKIFTQRQISYLRC